MKQINLIVKQRKESFYLMMNQNLCHIWEASDYQNSNPRNNFIEFSIHISSASVNCSNKILLEENQHVVMENNECQYGEEWKKNRRFQIFGPSEV